MAEFAMQLLPTKPSYGSSIKVRESGLAGEQRIKEEEGYYKRVWSGCLHSLKNWWC